MNTQFRTPKSHFDSLKNDLPLAHRRNKDFSLLYVSSANQRWVAAVYIARIDSEGGFDAVKFGAHSHYVNKGYDCSLREDWA
jgi:hypothetical protein